MGTQSKGFGRGFKSTFAPTMNATQQKVLDWVLNQPTPEQREAARLQLENLRRTGVTQQREETEAVETAPLRKRKLSADIAAQEALAAQRLREPTVRNRVMFRDTGDDFIKYVYDAQGNLVSQMSMAQSPTALKKIRAISEDLAPGLSMVDKIRSLASNVIKTQPAEGLTDFGAMLEQAKQGVRVKLGAKTRTDRDAVAFEGAVNTFLSFLSRASGEKGVLTTQDVDRIKAAMPTAFDNIETFDAGLSVMEDTYRQILEDKIAIYQKTGGKEPAPKGAPGKSTKPTTAPAAAAAAAPAAAASVMSAIDAELKRRGAK